jgi:hypothetical protein
MANCNSLTGISKSCDNNIGGIRGIWLFDMEDIQTLTENPSTWAIDELTLAGSPTVLPTGFEFIRNSSNFTEENPIDLVNGSSFITVTLNLMFSRREASKSKSIKVLGEGQRYLGAVTLDSNGIYWLFTDLQLSNVAEGSGTAKADGSKYAVTLLGEVPNFAKVIATADAELFIATGSTEV